MKKIISVITLLLMLIVTVVSPKIEFTVNAAIDSEPIFLIDQITGDGISTANAIIVLENNGTQNVGKLIAEKGDHHVYIFEGVNYENLLQEISFKRINPENKTQVWNKFTASKGNSNKYSINAWDNTAFSDQSYDLKFVEDRLDFTHENNLMVDATLIDIEYKDPYSPIPKLDKLTLKINDEYDEYLFHLNKNGSFYTLPDFIKLQPNDDIKVVDKRFPGYATTKSVKYKEDSDFCINLNALNPYLANKFDILDSTDCDIKNPYKNDYIPTGTKVMKSDVRYVKSTFYDYLSDWELNNQDRFKKEDTTDNWDHRVKDDLYVQFRHFNQALSDYYEDNKIINPIYTGHFDHHKYNGSSFNRVANGLNLYGYEHHAKDSTLYNKFFAYNNSMFDIYGNELNKEEDKPYGAQIVRNIVDSNLSSSGELTINDKSSPFFNSQFLLGDNSKKTVLAHLYENVDFPFYEEKREGSDVSYWTFDSRDHPLQMKRDKDTYFLDDDNVRTVVNRNSGGENLNVNGFFPFNGPEGTNGDVYKYNYGFGVRMDIPFHLTEDGKIDEEDIIFEFSGDDDVWIFIDGKLVLDLGGAHARVAGQINFAEKTYEITAGHIKNLGENTDKTKKGTIDIDGKLTDRHILSVYYMERGLWESNLKITFNFPEDDVFVLEKELNLDNVNDDFKKYFEEQEFEFEIENYATHYQTVKDLTDGKTGFKVNQEYINDYGSVASNAFKSIENAKYNHSSLDDIQSYANNLILKDQENAVFSNQFRKGSYLYINETLDDKLYQEPTWKIIENDITIFEGSGNIVNDNRVEPVIEGDPIKNSYNGNIEGAYKGNTLRYGTLETTGATEPTHMRVIYTNKVKTGNLIIKKEFLGDTDQEAEFEVKVIFEKIEKTYQFKLKNDETYEIKGLPYGTKYEVKEIASDEYLLSINDKSLTEINGIIDEQEKTYTFLNTPYSELEIEKIWENTPEVDQFEVSMKLFKNDDEYKEFKLNKENGFKEKIKVPKYDADGNKINYKFYEYFAGTQLEDGNIFETEDGHRFEVTYGDTYVNNKLIPSSDLTFTKVRNKNGNVIELNGAHFTLKGYKIDKFDEDTDYFVDYLNNSEKTPEHTKTINPGKPTFTLENLYSDYVYFLQETKAPIGMQLPKGAWMIHIDEKDKIHIVAEFQDSMPALEVNQNEGGDRNIYIYNVPISTLPLTGGYMRHYSIIGLSIIGLSYVLYKNDKKKEKKENE